MVLTSLAFIGGDVRTYVGADVLQPCSGFAVKK
jgi:hypothetical protein